MNTQGTLSFLPSVHQLPARHELRQAPRPRSLYSVVEYGVVALRESLSTKSLVILDNPESLVEYARTYLLTSSHWRPRVENFACVFLNTRRRAIGHSVISTGTMDTLLVHPREVFYTAIELNASALIMLHNHPSGDSTPSDSDIRVTRELMRAGQLLKIDVIDHIILGVPSAHAGNARGYTSLRELGHFYC